MANTIFIDHDDMVHTERNKSGILYRNFSGRPNNFGNTNRTFTILVTEDTARMLEHEGFKIRRRLNYDEEEECLFDIRITYGLPYYPVHVYQVTERGKTCLNWKVDPETGKEYEDEDGANVLDTDEIQFADLKIRSYHWSRRDGASGVKAELVDGYFVIAEDRFASRYNFD